MADARIATGVEPEQASAAAVRSRFQGLLADRVPLRIAGAARAEPGRLLTRAYLPRSVVRVFDATVWLSNYRWNKALGFFVAFVMLGDGRGRRVREVVGGGASGAGAGGAGASNSPGRRTRVDALPRGVHPRIFYKDSSLMWRVASHFVHDEHEFWLGKGDVRIVPMGEDEVVYTAEETTNLPFELQGALDVVSRREKRVRDERAIELVLREGPSGRIEPYADFTRPRREAAAGGEVNGGRSVAWFEREGDPRSLRFAAGFEPDLTKRGVIEDVPSYSSFFGGELHKVRVLSKNRQIQYLFMASPTHVWVCPPQTLTTELTTYGVRTLDVLVHDDLCVPGYEYHEEGNSQIPEGFAGAPHPKDPHRADASAWLDALPVIRAFRRRVLPRLG